VEILARLAGRQEAAREEFEISRRGAGAHANTALRSWQRFLPHAPDKNRDGVNDDREHDDG